MLWHVCLRFQFLDDEAVIMALCPLRVSDGSFSIEVSECCPCSRVDRTVLLVQGNNWLPDRFLYNAHVYTSQPLIFMVTFFTWWIFVPIGWVCLNFHVLSSLFFGVFVCLFVCFCMGILHELLGKAGCDRVILSLMFDSFSLYIFVLIIFCDGPFIRYVHQK